MRPYLQRSQTSVIGRREISMRAMSTAARGARGFGFVFAICASCATYVDAPPIHGNSTDVSGGSSGAGGAPLPAGSGAAPQAGKTAVGAPGGVVGGSGGDAEGGEAGAAEGGASGGVAGTTNAGSGGAGGG